MKFSTHRSLLINIFLFLLIIGLIIFVIRDSLGALFLGLRATPAPLLLLVTFMGLFSLVIEGYTIKTIAGEYQPDFRTSDGFFASAYGMFYRIVTFGTGSIISEVIYYHKKGLTYSQGTGVVALRMVAYKIALMLWSVVFLILEAKKLQAIFPNGIFLAIAGIAVTLVVVTALLVFSLHINAQVAFVIVANRFIKKQSLRNLVDRINDQFYSLRETIQVFIRHRRVVVLVFCSNMAKLCVWYALPYLILRLNYPDISLFISVALISFTVVIGGVIPAPGGIGGFEFVYVIMFKQLITKVDALSSLLLYRYATYLLPFLVGMLYVLVKKQQEIKQEIREIKKEKDD